MSAVKELIDAHTDYICDNVWQYKAAVAWGEIRAEATKVFTALEAAGLDIYSISSGTNTLTASVRGVTNIRKAGSTVVESLEPLGYQVETWKTEDDGSSRELSSEQEGKPMLAISLYPDGDRCKFRVVETIDKVITESRYELECPEDEESAA